MKAAVAVDEHEGWGDSHVTMPGDCPSSMNSSLLRAVQVKRSARDGGLFQQDEA